MEIVKAAERAYTNAKSKGFWDNRKVLPIVLSSKGVSDEDVKTIEDAFKSQALFLIASEAVEAMEAVRKGKYCTFTGPGSKKVLLEEYEGAEFVDVFEKMIKDTEADELADIAIRLFDYAFGNGIDLEFHIEAKMKYNSTRDAMHGKKF